MPQAERDPAHQLITTAFAEAERRGWRGLTIPALARKAGMNVAAAYRIAPDMASLLDVYAERIDAEVADELARETDDLGEAGEWREPLFDAFMRRFDAMQKDREALRVIFIEERRDLIALPRAVLRARRSMERLLEAAGLGEDPLIARAAALALVPLYVRLFAVWLKDEPDQAKTMAALDKALRRIERWLDRTRFPTRRGASPGEEPAQTAAAKAPSSETKH